MTMLRSGSKVGQRHFDSTTPRKGRRQNNPMRFACGQGSNALPWYPVSATDTRNVWVVCISHAVKPAKVRTADA